MKSCKTITLPVRLRDVRRVAPAAAPGAEQVAYDRGRRDGEKALSEQLLQQRTELVELHRGVVESLRAVLPQLIQETEKALVEVALQAAMKIVADTPINSKLVEAVVREAVKQVEDTSDITIHLHADDFALLHKHKSPILEGLPETGPLRFTSSSDVTRGGCLIRTSFGLLDARRETKLEQLRQSVAA